MTQIKLFGIKIHPLSKSDFLKIIESDLKNGNRIIQHGINAASINELSHNRKLLQAYNNSDLINIDGMSVVWALRLLGKKVPERVACPDLANDILSMAEIRGFSVFFFGASEESISLCVTNVHKYYPELKVAGYRNGFYTEDEENMIVDTINRADPDILFLGMPSPRKELFIEEYKYKLSSKYILGVGGYFDILSGMTKRAPKWMQVIGMEWFYRFIQEPGRLFRRYLFGNIRFIGLVLKEMFKKNG